MVDVRPFSGIRPRNEIAEKVISPPYDVLTLAEANELAKNRLSFVRVTRSEVDLPPGADAHSSDAYEMARKNLRSLIADGSLQTDDAPTYYFYGQKMGTHTQVGILAACNVEEYDNNIIKKHEYTRPDKEDDRTEHMDILDHQVGLVFLTYRASAAIDEVTKKVTANSPCWSVQTEDGTLHTLWTTPSDLVDEVRDGFRAIDALYIADGHHRSAAASRIKKRRGSEQSAHFLAGVFPDSSLQVMAYNRVVHDLNGHRADAFLQAVDAKFDRTPGTEKPSSVGEISMYFEKAWWSLKPKVGSFEPTPVKSLDVSVLQDNLLGPVLGIDDPRTSKRITFVGGIRGPEALVKAVDGGHAVAFHLFPTPLDALFAVADNNNVMPPKSTWFEPKLREGVVIRAL